jgi:hypothetical protein
VSILQCRFYEAAACSGTFWRGDERVNVEQMALKVSRYRWCMAAHGIVTVAEFERC